MLQAVHSSAVGGGHAGIQTTYYMIRSLFSWPQMKNDVHQFVQQCQVCQQAKSEHIKVPGLLQPLPIPEQAWQLCAWILWKVFQNLRSLTQLWLWWISSLSMGILFL